MDSTAQSTDAPAPSPESRLGFIKERIAFVKALKSQPSAPKQGECQYAMAMEVLGVYIGHLTVTQMVARGELPPGLGTYLNMALARMAFNVYHGCSHGSVSQKNEDHTSFENMVFRIAAIPEFTDDGFYEYHMRHHQATNTVNDPDLFLAKAPLEMIGAFLKSEQVAELSDREQGTLWFHWDNVLLKLAGYEGIHTLIGCGSDDAELAHLGKTLFATWYQSARLSSLIGILFFARYPHRNCPMENEVDNYFDTTNRGMDQVDLWMQGEGFHHAHHAITNIGVNRLARVGLETEAAHPEYKTKARGFTGTSDGEDGSWHRVKPDDKPPCQRAWIRTQKVERNIDLLPTQPEKAITGIAEAVLTSALEVCLLADTGLLRDLHSQMTMDTDRLDVPVAMGSWSETVFSESNKERLRAEASHIRERVLASAAQVGAKFKQNREAAGIPALAGREDLKECYLDFFEACAQTFISEDVFKRFLEHFAASLPHVPTPVAGCQSPKEAIRQLLEKPMPRDVLRVARKEQHADKGDQETTRQRIAELVTCIRSRL